MKTNYNPMAGGLIILTALVTVLGVPMLVGHFTLKPHATAMIQVSAVSAQ
jgi:hypothetical protein